MVPITLYESRYFYCRQFYTHLQTKQKDTDLLLKIRREKSSLFFFFFSTAEQLSPQSREKTGEKNRKNEYKGNCKVSEYAPILQPLWVGKAKRMAFPFQSFHWVNYTGHISSLCMRFHLQNGNSINNLFCKVFQDLMMRKKKQKQTKLKQKPQKQSTPTQKKHTPKPKKQQKNPYKLSSSCEFHENSACKLCVSVILNTLPSWLQYYY